MKQASMKMGNTKRRPTLPAAGEPLRPCTARDPSRHTTMMNRHSLTHPSVDRKKKGTRSGGFDQSNQMERRRTK